MHLSVGSANNLPFPDKFFQLTIGSPPYLWARTYGLTDLPKNEEEWVAFMTDCTYEALRVTDGPVLWVVAGLGGSEYVPGPEMLISDLYRQERCYVLRPNIWVKNAPPTGSRWFSNDWEYVMAFSNEVPLRTWNPEAIATPLKYSNGGKFRQRNKDGVRKVGSAYPKHTLRKRPSNVHNVNVGGGHMGWKEATKVNEAPFPEALVARFIKTLTNPGDKVFDPFAGSGTTPCVAELLGRIGYGIDIRPEQVKEASRREKYIAERLRSALELKE